MGDLVYQVFTRYDEFLAVVWLGGASKEVHRIQNVLWINAFTFSRGSK